VFLVALQEQKFEYHPSNSFFEEEEEEKEEMFS
jgi:hypothetical protein